MNNLIFRINSWLDNHEILKLFILIALILALSLSISFENKIGFFLFSFFLLIITTLTICRINIISGKMKLKKEKYILPTLNEVFIVKHKFFWLYDLGQYSYKIKNGTSYYEFDKKEEFIVEKIKELNNDWRITLTNKSNLSIDIKYFEFKKYFESKLEIRNNKLKQIGIK